MRRVATSTIMIALLIGSMSACGDSDSDGPAAQPAPDVTTFGQGDFDEIPLPPLADVAGERSVRSGVVVQSYFVRNRTPEQVVRFYETYFEGEGISAIASPEPFGNEGWRGSWLVGDRELLVSALPAPTAGGEAVEHADVVTQMSLELSPADGGDHENDPVGTDDS